MQGSGSRARVTIGAGSVTSAGTALFVQLTCCALVLVLLALGHSVRWSEALPAVALQAVIAALLMHLERPPRDELSRPFVIAGLVAYLISVAMLRDAGGTQAGFGPLILLPVVWLATRSRRIELAVAVLGVGVIYVAPAVVIGPPRYPAGSWRAGVLFTAVAGAIGVSITHLVDRVHALLAQSSELALTDDLTGLPNRRAWRELLAHEVRSAARSGRSLTVVLLDLDHFKQLNDTRGHVAADQLLHDAARAWRDALRDADVLARWGGDEFALLLPDCDPEQASDIVERMRSAIPEAAFSAGIVGARAGSTPEEMLASADQALYADKRTRDTPATALAASAP